MSSLALPADPVVSAAPRPTRRRARRLAAALSWLVEAGAVAIAVLSILPLFDRLTPLAAGREQRFLDRGIAVAALPDPVLPALCNAYGDLAAPALGAALCPSRWWDWRSRSESLSALPPRLAVALDRSSAAFTQPLRDAQARVDALQTQARQGDGALLDNADAVAAIEAAIAPFIERYKLAAGDTAGPAPLACNRRWIDSAFASRNAGPSELAAADSTLRADAALMLGAALDGRTMIGDDLGPLPPAAGAGAAGCASPLADLAATSTLMHDARQASANNRKSDAMRFLVASAGVQWAAAMALGYAFLLWSRRRPRPSLAIAIVLATWAAAAWLARVTWPLAGSNAFATTRNDASWLGAPAPFVSVLLALAALSAVVTLTRRPVATDRQNVTMQSMGSRLGFAGFVVLTGLGWLVLLDLSINGHYGNRYLALYHQGHLWLAMLLLSTLFFVRQDVSRGLAWILSVVEEGGRSAARRFGPVRVGIAAALLTAIGLLAFTGGLAHRAQLTSELGRVWLICGAAWFFFLRAGPMMQRLARAGPAGRSFLGYAWPMLFVVGVLVVAMFATHDMGPLLISGYASGAFVAATLAMWWHYRSGQRITPFALALVVFALWIAAVTTGLFRLGALDAVTASRLESVAAPFASINDQLAMVSWFQRAAPPHGFGLGTTPWCGFSTTGACSGVPAQIHSDYTLTALIGVFGPAFAWGLAVAAAWWLHRLIRHHGRVTGGEPRLVDASGRLRSDGQALLTWISVAWVVMSSCQLAVTVAGNLAVLPLTGVTFPFVSFGMTSLLVNSAFLALCLNVDVPARGSDV